MQYLWMRVSRAVTLYRCGVYAECERWKFHFQLSVVLGIPTVYAATALCFGPELERLQQLPQQCVVACFTVMTVRTQ